MFSSTLNIANASLVDTGSYYCQIRRGDDFETSNSIQLTVIGGSIQFSRILHFFFFPFYYFKATSFKILTHGIYRMGVSMAEQFPK